MQVSRSLGDKSYKGKGVVIPDPHVKIHELTRYDNAILLACDGVFEKMTYEDVTDIICDELRKGSSAEEISKMIVEQAIERGSGDNVTAIVIILNWE